MKAIKPSFLTPAILLALLAACAPSDVAGDDDSTLPPPQQGDAYLSIVGDPSVFLESGEQKQVTVKYHDGDGNPLAGQITFAWNGDPRGANLASTTGVTNSMGLVTVSVTGGQEAAFQLTANAQYALPVAWNVAVAPGTQPLAPLDPAGEYEVESQFDLATGLPGSVGNVVNTIIDMTDDPTDPATWLIDAALQQISSNTLVNLVNAFRPALDGFVNDALLQAAPDFVTNLVNLGDDFGQVARKFGTVTTLKVTAGNGPDGVIYTAKHSIIGFQFIIDGATYEYSLAELSLGAISAENIPVAVDGEIKVTIAEHELPVSYGHLLLFALNNVVIPGIDPFAHNLRELLQGMVDCYEIGWTISDYVGIGSPSTYEAACDAALGVAAGAIESQILAIDDTGSALHIHGDAKPLDTTGDRKVDKLNGGLWEGTMTFGPVTSTLAKPNQKFTGKKMGLP